MFAKAEYSLKKETWRASISITLTGQSIRYTQFEYDLNKEKDEVFLNPNAHLTLLLNQEDYFTLNYDFNRNLGKISNVYRGAVLANFRTIYANDADLQEQQISNLALAYNFKRSIIMLFAAVRLDYNKTASSTITSSQLTDNIQRTVLLPYQNEQHKLFLNIDLSKYIFALNTGVFVNAVISTSNYNQLVNSQMYPFNNNALTMQAKLESKLFGALTLSYSGIGLWNTSKQKSTESLHFNIKTKRIDQNINLGYTPFNNLYINLLGKYIYGKQSNLSNINYFFMDVKARYNVVKWRTDLELNITNLANIKSYDVFSVSSNQFLISRYDIRGRMAIIRATFKL